MATVISETGRFDVEQQSGEGLWVDASKVSSGLGWEMKPEGFCKGNVCVPLPAGREAEFVRDGSVNLSSLWEHMGKPVARSADADVWSLGESAEDRNAQMLSLQAPDFELPDFSGKLHRLTDYRRQKILLITWASW